MVSLFRCLTCLLCVIPTLAQNLTVCEVELLLVLEEFDSLVPTNIYSAMAVYSGRWLGDLGNYFDCIDLEQANYALFEISLGGTSTTFSLCGPKSCSVSDYYELIGNLSTSSPSILKLGESLRQVKPSLIKKKGFKQAPDEVQIGIVFPQQYIHDNFGTLNAGAIAMLVVCCIIGVIMLAGTLLDLQKQLEISAQNRSKKDLTLVSKDNYLQMKEINEVSETASSCQREVRISVLKEVLLCFSVYTNLPKLFASRSADKVGTPKDPLEMLNGVRVMSMGWVMLGHVYLFRVRAGINKNPQDFPDECNKVKTAMIYGAFFAVDTFFWLSGFLMAFLLLQGLNTEKGMRLMGWLYLYFHRLYRILPAYAFVCFMCWAFTKYMGNGPVWVYGDILNIDCHSWWWTNLIFLNNFIPDYEGNGCLGQSWYLANDMQFFWISPPIFYIYYKFSKVIGWAILGFLCTVSIVTSAVIADYKDYNVVILANGMGTETDDIYIKPYCRVAPYALGIGCGMIIYTQRHFRKTGKVYDKVAHFLGQPLENRYVRYGIYAFGAFLINFFIFIQYNAYKDVDHGWTSWNLTETVLFYGFQRLFWGLGISMIFLPMLLGHGAIARWFMSLNLWTPLARLTFCCYLVHLNLICIVDFSLNTAYWFNDLNVTIDFVFIIVISYGAAIPLTLAVESPFMAMEKVFKQRKH